MPTQGGCVRHINQRTHGYKNVALSENSANVYTSWDSEAPKLPFLLGTFVRLYPDRQIK